MELPTSVSGFLSVIVSSIRTQYENSAITSSVDPNMVSAWIEARKSGLTTSSSIRMIYALVLVCTWEAVLYSRPRGASAGWDPCASMRKFTRLKLWCWAEMRLKIDFLKYRPGGRKVSGSRTVFFKTDSPLWRSGRVEFFYLLLSTRPSWL